MEDKRKLKEYNLLILQAISGRLCDYIILIEFY